LFVTAMSDIAITAENLSKSYWVGHRSAQRESYTALRDVIAREARNFARKTVDLVHGRQIVQGDDVEQFWALRDVSFEVKRGEVLGIIGRNGAGKSTLLKILSRITEPDHGRVTLRGRVASLLEVGTGFHPELSGRENIFLNGAILGMTKSDIRRKFDEIVEFAEIDRFLDTPVKRYSSGMYVRLAFAIAAHLEPEILIVDEVLAVGDAAFQERCIGKMKSVAKTDGRTVLFVSHNMVAVKALCKTGLWLQQGTIQQSGLIHDVAQTYLVHISDGARTGTISAGNTKGDGQVELISYRVTNAAGKSDPPPGTKEDVLIHVKMKIESKLAQPAYGISIVNNFGVLLTSISTVEQGVITAPLPAGESEICVRIKDIVFLPGIYTASFWIMNPQGHIFAMAKDAIAFEISEVPLYGTCQVDHRWGCVYSDIRFSIERSSELVEP
jgi:lipopolysaccharide transport system ATP-binding protein